MTPGVSVDFPPTSVYFTDLQFTLANANMTDYVDPSSFPQTQSVLLDFVIEPMRAGNTVDVDISTTPMVVRVYVPPEIQPANTEPSLLIILDGEVKVCCYT